LFIAVLNIADASELKQHYSDLSPTLAAEQENSGHLSIAASTIFELHDAQLNLTFVLIPNARTQEIRVCNQVGLCSDLALTFKHIIRSRSIGDRTSFGIVDLLNQLRICSLTDFGPAVSCGESLPAFEIGKPNQKGEKLEKKFASGTPLSKCILSPSRGVECSKVRQLVGNPLVFSGGFTNANSVELVRLDLLSPSLCDTSAGRMECSEVKGLNKIAKMPVVASARLTKDGLSTLVGMDGNTVQLCVPNKRTKNISFDCIEIEGKIPNDSKLYLVPAKGVSGYERLQIVDGKSKRKSAIYESKDSLNIGVNSPIYFPNSNHIRQALQGLQVESGLRAKVAAQNTSLYKTLDDNGGDPWGNNNDYWPYHTSFENDTDAWQGFDFWSDAFNVFQWDRNQWDWRTPRECIEQTCVPETADNLNLCVIFGGTVFTAGLTYTAYATVSTAVTGPGAAAVAASGTAASATAGGIAAAVCSTGAGISRIACIIRCNQNPG